jgi:hypothetical protein
MPSHLLVFVAGQDLVHRLMDAHQLASAGIL